MKILAFYRVNSGPDYHRVTMPCGLMDGPDVVASNAPKEEQFAACDIFIYSRTLPDNGLEKLLALKEKYGFRIVVDIDDWWYLDRHHIMYEEYQKVNFAQKQIDHLRAADVIFVTHDRLAAAVEDVIELRAESRPPYIVKPTVHVLPNAIPRVGQFDIKASHSDMVRIFWQGTETHQEDLRLLERPSEGLASISKQIRMVMGGFHGESGALHEMARYYTADFKHQYRLIESKPITDYYGMYKEADICLVPLINSPFNRMKSNLKILEAANMGLPVIASGVHPYLGMPVSYCKHPRDWVGHIKRLVQFPARRKEEGERLAEFCKEHYNFHKINEERKQILEYELSKTI